MNELQKAEITRLRKQGEGYRIIANNLGLSRDIVRNFCKKHGLDGLGTEVTKNIELKQQAGILCSYCNKPLKQHKHGRQRRFCSDECRRAWWKENADKGNRKETAMYKAKCAYCGTEFESYGNKNRKYCSHDCYINDRFGKDKTLVNSTQEQSE